MKPSEIRPEWLQLDPLPSLDVVFAMTVALTDAGLPQATVDRMAGNPPPKLRTDWAAFVAHAAAGDELRYFKSGGALAGRSGFVIVRAGTPIAVYITSMS